jgi:hypothetical protein
MQEVKPKAQDELKKGPICFVQRIIEGMHYIGVYKIEIKNFKWILQTNP